MNLIWKPYVLIGHYYRRDVTGDTRSWDRCVLEQRKNKFDKFNLMIFRFQVMTNDFNAIPVNQTFLTIRHRLGF